MNELQITPEQKSRVVHKLFAELGEILSEKYGCEITFTLTPKPGGGAENGKQEQEGA